MRGNEKLRAELERLGLKPSDIARTTGLDRKTVREILSGSLDVRLKDVAAVAAALSFRVDIVITTKSALDKIVDVTISKKRRRKPRVKWS